MNFFVNATPEAFSHFKSLPRGTAIHMLNLVRYKEWAEYPKGHPQSGSSWSGRRAYEEYGRLSEPILRSIGGEIVWRGAFEAMVIGDPEQVWDDAFIAHYPDVHALLRLLKDPEFGPAFVHRDAGVLDYRLMRFAPGKLGGGFAA